MWRAQLWWLKVVAHGGDSGINGVFHPILSDVQDIILLIQLVMRFPPQLFNDSMMLVHQHYGFLPKDNMRHLVLKAGSPPAWRITIPGLVKAIFFYPSLESSLYVFI